jgi:hypothetical protein
MVAARPATRHAVTRNNQQAWSAIQHGNNSTSRAVNDSVRLTMAAAPGTLGNMARCSPWKSMVS